MRCAPLAQLDLFGPHAKRSLAKLEWSNSRLRRRETLDGERHPYEAGRQPRAFVPAHALRRSTRRLAFLCRLLAFPVDCGVSTDCGPQICEGIPLENRLEWAIDMQNVRS